MSETPITDKLRKTLSDVAVVMGMSPEAIHLMDRKVAEAVKRERERCIKILDAEFPEYLYTIRKNIIARIEAEGGGR